MFNAVLNMAAQCVVAFTWPIFHLNKRLFLLVGQVMKMELKYRIIVN